MKIGVIGTGYWGPNIIRNLLALNQEIILYDTNKSNLHNTLQKFHDCDSVSSIEGILLNPDVNSVAVVVPLKQHYKLIIKSLKARKNVFVEKSLCYSTDEADRIKIYLRDKVLMVGHTTLFTPGITKIKELINSNRIGKLTSFHFTRTHLGKIYPGIDVASEVASHDIATMLFLIKEIPDSVNAWGNTRLGLNKQDNATVILRYKGSPRCTINVQWTSAIRARMVILEGTTGTIVNRTDNGKEELLIYDQRMAFECLKKNSRPEEAVLKMKSENITIPCREPLYDELNCFLQCVNNNLIPLTDYKFGRKVVTILEALRRSIKQNGKTVKITW